MKRSRNIEQSVQFSAVHSTSGFGALSSPLRDANYFNVNACCPTGVTVRPFRSTANYMFGGAWVTRLIASN
ncbi:hypothetical protein, partial [Agrobacterium tumefaciens]|uniref:hypothetical protein n=1 Tax=Agrobacterium tumefaciens TaxID=358 RepID=UPI003BA025E6